MNLFKINIVQIVAAGGMFVKSATGHAVGVVPAVSHYYLQDAGCGGAAKRQSQRERCLVSEGQASEQVPKCKLDTDPILNDGGD